MLFIILGNLGESQNDKRLRLVREKHIIGSELVRSAAIGDVEKCRQILEKERITEANQANQEPTEELANQNYGLPPGLAALGRNNARPSTAEEIVLANYISGGDTPLQAAAQNGRVDVCRMLIGEFNTDIEFQV